MTITQALLPNGRQQFFDSNGAPVAGGSVGMYEPGGLVFKDTFQDPEGAVANINPVPLDAAGEAFIYGSGQYRQIVKKADGTVVWDALTFGLPSNGVGPGGSGGFGPQTAIASAVTTQLSIIDSHNALVTGNVGITSFGNGADINAPIYYVEFDSDPVVFNSAALLLPGGKDIATGPGDGMLVEYENTSNWKVIAYFPATGIGAGSFQGSQQTTAAAATTDLGTVGTNNVLVTGNTGITSFGNAASVANPLYYVEFSGTPTITHDDANLICPAGADIEVTAGDSCIAEFLGAGAWKISAYFRIQGEGGNSTQSALVAAATTNLGSAKSQNILISGNTGITSFGASAKTSAPIYLVEFSGTPLLTYNAASMILPGGANIQVAAGDTAAMEYLGGGNWKMRAYQALAIPPSSSGAGIAKQGLVFTVAAGVYAQVSAFGGMSAVRVSAGQFTVTLGATPLQLGFCVTEACNNGSGDGMGIDDPTTPMVASGVYTFQWRFSSSKTAADPEVGMILVY